MQNVELPHGLSNIIGGLIDDHVVPIVEDSFSSLRGIELKSVPCHIEKSGGAFNG